MSNRIVVVGASMAGLRTAEQLRSADWSGEIVLVGDETHLPYNRPPLSKEALVGGGSVPELLKTLEFRRRPSIDDATWMLGRRAVLVKASVDDTARGCAATEEIGHTPSDGAAGTATGGAAGSIPNDPGACASIPAASVDTRTPQVVSSYLITLDDGTRLETDGIVVATGVAPRRLPFASPVPTAAAGRHVMRTVDDAAALHRELTPGARVVIVGGGLIGCEVAATATQLGCHATVIVGTSGRGTGASIGAETAALPNSAPSALSGPTASVDRAVSASAPLPRACPPSVPMRRVLGNELGSAVGDFLRERAVEFVTGRVGGLTADSSGRVRGVTLDSGETLPADLIVEAIGAAPEVDWLNGIGIDIGDGVLTDASLAAISTSGEVIPGVVAVGDVARFPAWRDLGPARRVEHWQTAIDTAKIAARTLVAQLTATESSEDPGGGLTNSAATAPVADPAAPVVAPTPAPLPSFWSDVFGVRIQGYGVTGSELDGTGLETVLLEGSLDELEAGATLGYLLRGEPVGVVTAGLPSSRQLYYRKLILDRSPFAVLV